MAWMAAVVASSRAWPGEGQAGPGAVGPAHPDAGGVLGGTVGAEGELVRVPAQGLHIGLQLLGQGGAVQGELQHQGGGHPGEDRLELGGHLRGE